MASLYGKDLVLDTDVLGDFLAQYFDAENADRGYGRFVRMGFVSEVIAKELNLILRRHRKGLPLTGMVVASSFAFLELSRKWDDISWGRYTLEQFRAFIAQPPDWFDVAPLDWDVCCFYCGVSHSVCVSDQSAKRIEWTDAIHVATTLSRENGYLLTSDRRLRVLPELRGRILRAGRPRFRKRDASAR